MCKYNYCAQNVGLTDLETNETWKKTYKQDIAGGTVSPPRPNGTAESWIRTGNNFAAGMLRSLPILHV